MELEEKIREKLNGSYGNDDIALPPAEEKKKPKNAFTLFVADQKERILRDNPTLDFNKIVSLSALKWKRLGEDERAIYEKKFNDLTKLYEKRDKEQEFKSFPEKEAIVKKEDDSNREGEEEEIR
jgi:hypothetical protein